MLNFWKHWLLFILSKIQNNLLKTSPDQEKQKLHYIWKKLVAPSPPTRKLCSHGTCLLVVLASDPLINLEPSS